MASDTIKGLTAKIGADTSDFIKELKKVDKSINNTQKQANELQKGLELKFDSQKFNITQKQVQSALEETRNKAKAIRDELKYLEQTDGVNTEGYKNLQIELAKTETKGLQLENQLKKLDEIKFNNATKSITNLSDSLETAGKKTAILSATSAALLVGMGKLAKDAINVGDTIQTTADQYNLSAESIQKWNYIALQTDVPSEQLYKSMTKVRDAIGTALVGNTNNATKAIEALGLSFSNIGTDDEAFSKIISALGNVEDSTLRAYYANEIFGERIATELIPLLNQGGDAINKYSKEFQQVGYLSNEQVEQLANLDNELNKVTTQFNNAKTELGIALIPVLQIFTDLLSNYVIPAIQKLSEWINSLPTPMQNVIVGGTLLVASLSPVFLIMSKLIGVIPSLIKLFNTLNLTTLKTATGFTLLFGAIGTAFELITKWEQLSPIIKILGLIAVAAMTAAAAVTIFQASLTMGVAVGIIAAAVAAGIAMISSASKSIGVDTNFNIPSDVGSINSSDYNIPTQSTQGNIYNEDNSEYNINVSLNATGDLNYDAKSLADEVIKQIQVKKQASGR